MATITVKDLKEALKDFPDDMLVKKYCYTGEYNDPWQEIEWVDSETKDHSGREVSEIVIL